MRILIIDDDRAILTSLRSTLEYEGYQVVGASNGWDGLALVDHDSVNLVLLDVGMPDISGLDVLRQLHQTHESVPILMMSAAVTPAIRVEAIRAGAVDVLEKPFESTAQLCATIRNAIERAQKAASSRSAPEAVVHR